MKVRPVTARSLFVESKQAQASDQVQDQDQASDQVQRQAQAPDQDLDHDQDQLRASQLHKDCMA